MIGANSLVVYCLVAGGNRFVTVVYSNQDHWYKVIVVYCSAALDWHSLDLHNWVVENYFAAVVANSSIANADPVGGMVAVGYGLMVAVVVVKDIGKRHCFEKCRFVLQMVNL